MSEKFKWFVQQFSQTYDIQMVLENSDLSLKTMSEILPEDFWHYILTLVQLQYGKNYYPNETLDKIIEKYDYENDQLPMETFNIIINSLI
jgi:hypothetical protein